MPRGTSIYDEAMLQRRLITPLDIFGNSLAEWWDPNQRLTSTAAGFSGWAGRIQGISATQGTAANQPTLAFVNNQRRLAFNGSQNLYFTTNLLPQGTDATSMFVSAAFLSSSTSFMSPFGYSYGNHTGRIFYSNPNAFFATAGGPDNATGLSWAQKDFLIEAVIDSSSNIKVFVDGSLRDAEAVATTSYTGFTQGGIGYWPGFGGSWIGTVGHIVVARGVVTASQRQDYEGWESWNTGKFGANLPASHPFKNRPPLIGD